MFSEREKKGIPVYGLSRQHIRKFPIVEWKKAKDSRGLDDYIVFLNALQKIKPFEHKRVITRAEKNIL